MEVNHTEDGSASFRLPREPRVVLWMRLFTLIAIAGCAGVCGGLAYQFLRQGDVARFTQEFNTVTQQLESTLRSHLRDLRDEAEDTAAELQIPYGGRALITGIQARGTRKLHLSKAVSAQIVAIVPAENRTDFEAWALANAKLAVSAIDGSPSPRAVAIAQARYAGGIVNVVGPSGPDNGGAIRSGSAYKLVFPKADESILEEYVHPEYKKAYWPVIQGFPLELTASSYMIDASNLTERREMIRLIGRTGQSASGGLSLALADVMNRTIRPMTVFSAPVKWADPDTSIMRHTGSCNFNYYWDQILEMLLAETASMEVVLFSAVRNLRLTADTGELMDTRWFTFRVKGQAVENVGWGDQHSESSDIASYARVIRGIDGFESFTFTVYPTMEMYNAYMSRLPQQALIGSVLLIIGIAAFFAGFDVLSRRHYNTAYMISALANAETSVEKEKMRSRHAFVSMVSHEIRTPASAIVGALDVLHSTDLSPQQREFLETIHVGSSQILALVEDALTVGSGTGQFTMHPELVNPRLDILERSWNTIRLQKRYADKCKSISMALEIASEIPERCIIDAPRACQVICNLMGNAVKFVEEGTGVVMMKASFVDGMLTVSVTDNGRGLTAEGIARLFKPFSQAEGTDTKARFGGTGLGLVISRDIARAMEGDLTVRSAGLGTGATFVATMRAPQADDFPAIPPSGPSCTGGADWISSSGGAVGLTSPQPQPPADGAFYGVAPLRRSPQSDVVGHDGHPGAPLPSIAHVKRSLDCAGGRSTVSGGGGGGGDYGGTGGAVHPGDGAAATMMAKYIPRALAAEDDELCRRVLKMTLTLAGMDCTVVEHGEELSEMLVRDHHCADLIIVDSNMGGGERDGLPTIKRVVALFSRCNIPPPPIVVLSGVGEADIIQAFLKAGATRVLQKPASLKVLKSLLNLVNVSRISSDEQSVTVVVGGREEQENGLEESRARFLSSTF